MSDMSLKAFSMSSTGRTGLTESVAASLVRQWQHDVFAEVSNLVSCILILENRFYFGFAIDV